MTQNVYFGKEIYMNSKDKRDRSFAYGGLSNNHVFKKNKINCIDCGRHILNPGDGFNYVGMPTYEYLCKKCYWKRLD